MPDRYILVLPEDTSIYQTKLEKELQTTLLSSSELKGDGSLQSAMADGNSLLFKNLGIAVVDGVSAEQMRMLAEDNDWVISYEREREFTPVGRLEEQLDSVRDLAADLRKELQRFEDIVNDLKLSPEGPEKMTWGLQSVGWTPRSYTGKGIKVAVLDTGIDLGHPDFAGR